MKLNFHAPIGALYSDLIGPVVALVADSDQCAGAHVGVADDALTVALLTQTAYIAVLGLKGHLQNSKKCAAAGHFKARNSFFEFCPKKKGETQDSQHKGDLALCLDTLDISVSVPFSYQTKRVHRENYKLQR